MNKSTALELLKQYLSESPRTEEEYSLWCYKARDVIKAAFTEDSDEYQRFNDTFFGLVEKWNNMLPKQKMAVESILQKHDILGTLSTSDTVVVTAPHMDTTVQAPKAFIAHGGRSAALDKLCDFLRALGVVPLVAELQPSQGRLTEQQVDEQMSNASCAIILANYGYIVDARTSQRHPRLNVIDELGRCRRVFPDKIILLLEKRVELSSNVSGIVYERFTPQSMDKAFTKVAKELVAFGIIKAVKPG